MKLLSSTSKIARVLESLSQILLLLKNHSFKDILLSLTSQHRRGYSNHNKMEDQEQDPPASPPPHYNAVPPPPEYWDNARRNDAWLNGWWIGPPRPDPVDEAVAAPMTLRISRGRKLIISMILVSCFLYGMAIYYYHKFDACNASYDAIRTRLRAFYHGPDPFWKVWSHSHRVPDLFYPCTYFTEQILRMHRHFALSLGNFRAGRSHTLFTSTFMHYDIWTLLPDLWDLWFWGRPVISIIGLWHFSTLYVLGGLSGGLSRLCFDMLIEEKSGNSPRFAVGNSDSISALMVVLALTVPLYTIPFFHIPFVGASPLWILGWSFIYSLGAICGLWGAEVSHGHLAGYLLGLGYWVFVLKAHRIWDINRANIPV